MTTDPVELDPFAQARRRAWMWRGVTLLVLLSLGTAFWFFANNHAVKIKKEEPISQLMSVAPPPPPPPPPKVKEVVKEITPQALPQLQQLKQPAPTKDNAVTENAPAQEGADAFNIGAGTGEGMHGSGVAGDMERNLYANYVGRAINSAAQADANLNTRVFRVSLRIWLSATGKITRAELTSSDGSDADNQALKALIAAMPTLNPPPQSLLDTQPIHVAMTLRP